MKQVTDSGEGVVRQYLQAWPDGFDELARLRTDDFVEEWPQTGERIRGDANYRAIHSNYPGGLPDVTSERISGTADRWALSPSFTLVHLSGSGSDYTVEGTLAYPNGSTYKMVAVLQLAEGKVRSQRTYFAEQQEAPAWRAQWVERI
jgi:hypothetical protein